MAAPVWVSRTTLTGASSTSAVITLPASIAANDIILVSIYKENANAVTPAAGFAEKGTAPTTTAPQAQHTFWKRMAGGESGTITFSWTGNVWRAATCHRITGCVTTGDPIEAINSNSNNASVSTLNVSLASTSADTLLYWAATDFTGGNVWTQPTGYTEQSDIDVIGDATKTNAAGGATGNVTGTANVSGPMTAVLLSLLPDTGGAAPADGGMWLQIPRGLVLPVSPLYFPFTTPWAGDAAAAGTTFPVDQTDDAGLTDTSLVEVARTVTQTDSVGLADAVVVDQSKVFTDQTGLTDAAALTVSPVLTDTAGLTDAALVELSKLVTQTDSTGLTDVAALAQTKGVTDSAGLTDSAPLAQSKVLTDSVGLTDPSLIESGKTVVQTDSAGLTDGQAFSQAYVLTDTAGLTDARSLTISKTTTDSAGLTDAAAAGILRAQNTTDLVGLTDATVLTRSVVLSDLVGLADAVSLRQLYILTESVGLTDSAEASNYFPITFRPNTGTTSRPDGGITPRPNTGATARPAGGVTVRPDDGITERP